MKNHIIFGILFDNILKKTTMKKAILFFFGLLSTQIFAQSPMVYNYDYNLDTKIARIWIDYEILMEYDFIEDRLLHENYLFQDGYVFQKDDGNWEEIGFYNDKEMVLNQQYFEIKKPFLGKTAIRMEQDATWIPLKKTKRTISFLTDPEKLPEAAQIWALKIELQREIAYRERIHNRQGRLSVGIGVGVGTSL